MRKGNTCNDSAIEQDTPSQRVYTELGNDDVLLGRGTGPNEFEGNIRFRRLVAEVAMGTAPKELLSSKPALSRKVVDEVTSRGGKFVRKLSKTDVVALPNFTAKKDSSVSRIERRKDVYVEVPAAVAIEKAKQSFRHQQKIIDCQGGRSKAKGVGNEIAFKKPAGVTKKKDRPVLSTGGGSNIDDSSAPNDAGTNVESRIARSIRSPNPFQAKGTQTAQSEGPPSLPLSEVESVNNPNRDCSFLTEQQVALSSQNSLLLSSLAGDSEYASSSVLFPTQRQSPPEDVAGGMDLSNIIAHHLNRQRDLVSLLACSTSPVNQQQSFSSTQHPIPSSLSQDYCSSLLSTLRTRGAFSAHSPPLPALSDFLRNNTALPPGRMDGTMGTATTEQQLSASVFLQQNQVRLSALVAGAVGLGDSSLLASLALNPSTLSTTSVGATMGSTATSSSSSCDQNMILSLPMFTGATAADPQTTLLEYILRLNR